MEHKGVKWCSLPAQFISENSEIPHDIAFKFTEGDIGEVMAHKMVLAMVSRVFRNMFYVHDTVDKSAKEIVMQGTNKLAFQIMIDAMYNAKSMEESLRGSSVHEMFAVLYLVTKYEIHDLVLAVKDCLSSIPITEDTVLEVATDTMEYLTTFEEDSQDVLVSCAKFLKSKLIDYKSLLGFVTKNGDRITTVHKLLVLMDEMAPLLCYNCNSDPCLHGKTVEKSQCREGLLVADNPSARGSRYTWTSNLKYLTGEILEIVDNKKVQVKYRYAFLDSEEKSGGGDYNIQQNGELSFIFRCK